MSLPVIIAKNQTGTDIFLPTLGVAVPGSGQLELTINSPYEEISRDAVLHSAISSGDIIINDGSIDLLISEGIAYIELNNKIGFSGSAIGGALVKLEGTSGRLSISTGITIDSSDNMALGAGDITTTGVLTGIMSNLIQPIYVDYYDSGVHTITTTATTMPFDTERQSNAAFVLSGTGEVTVNTSGDYRIDYDMSMNDNASDSGIEMWLDIDSVEVPGTRTRMFHDADEESSGGHGMAILSLSASEVLRFRVMVISGSNSINTLNDSCRLMIHGVDGRAGPQGETGADGSPGSGSTINISEEGAIVSGGPHSNINFVGDAISAVDGGSGTVTVTIPPSPSIFAYDSVGGQTFTTAATTIILDSTSITNGIYSLSGGVVTINETGRFDISFAVSLLASSNSRSSAEIWVNLNGTFLRGTTRILYLKNSDHGASGSGNIIIDITSGDVVALRSWRVKGSTTCETVVDGSSLTIRRI